MKTKFFATLVAAASLFATASSQAQTVIRIVGSNGDRVATQSAIAHILAAGGNWTFQGTGGNTTGNSTTGTVSSVATAANYGAWRGTYNSTQVIIKVSFIGALGAINAVAGGNSVQARFVTSNGTGSGSVPDPTTGTQLGVDYELGYADFGFSTNFQTTSPFQNTYNGITYANLVEEVVGISPLGFYASPGFPGTNITTQLAQQLYTTGYARVSQFTGNSSDSTKYVFAIGRNTDAGQRYGALTEIGLGTTTPPYHWQPTITGQTTNSSITYGGNATSQTAWPAETVSGVFSADGAGGYTTGANLAPALTVTLQSDAYKGKYTYVDDNGVTQTAYLFPNATAGYYIGYLTPGDASNRVLGNNGVVPVANRGTSLSYNGVANTTANIQSGQYSLWVYNRIIRTQTFINAGGLKNAFADALRDQIKNVDATTSGLFDDASVTVKRLTDGGLVVPKS